MNSLSEPRPDAIHSRLQHSFDLMLEAVNYRLPKLREKHITLFELVPKAEYENIRIYVSELDKVRRLLAGDADEMIYVSFIGEHRSGALPSVEATDRALIGSSPEASPIIGYFSLQDPKQAWINLVLFDSLEMLSSWVEATGHADDWAKAAQYFSGIEKSIGRIHYAEGRVRLDPIRVTVRDYDL